MKKHIILRAFESNCFNTGTIELASVSFGKYGNIIFNDGVRNINFTAHPDDLKALRDALIEVYPLGVEAVRDYDEDAPKLGDTVQVKAEYKEFYTPLAALYAPLTITNIVRGFLEVRDARGTLASGWMPYRFETYTPPAAKPQPAANLGDILKAAIESTKPKWEVVADGLDRIKVPGGYIYQNTSDELLFVPQP